MSIWHCITITLSVSDGPGTPSLPISVPAAPGPSGGKPSQHCSTTHGHLPVPRFVAPGTPAVLIAGAATPKHSSSLCCTMTGTRGARRSVACTGRRPAARQTPPPPVLPASALRPTGTRKPRPRGSSPPHGVRFRAPRGICDEARPLPRRRAGSLSRRASVANIGRSNVMID
jgi:hypothetical protein